MIDLLSFITLPSCPPFYRVLALFIIMLFLFLIMLLYLLISDILKSLYTCALNDFSSASFVSQLIRSISNSPWRKLISLFWRFLLFIIFVPLPASLFYFIHPFAFPVFLLIFFAAYSAIYYRLLLSRIRSVRNSGS